MLALSFAEAGTFLNDTQSPLQLIACRATFDESKQLPALLPGFGSKVPIVHWGWWRQLSMHSSPVLASAPTDPTGSKYGASPKRAPVWRT